MNRPRALALLLLPALLGCRTVAEPPSKVNRRQVYQTIADALPRARFGWGSPPGIVSLAPSVKREGPAKLPKLRCDESGFLIHYEGYRPRSVWIPYRAISQASWGWKPIPNVFLAPLVFLYLRKISRRR